MPFIKGYKQTEESKRKISLANKGRVRTEEVKKRISETRKSKSHLYKVGHRYKKGNMSTLNKRWKVKGSTNPYYCKGKEYRRDQHLRLTYGIKLAEYSLMLKNQENKCLICRDTQLKRPLVVDHSHKTNKVRGLLCYKCNVALGLLRENEEIILSMLSYIKTHETSS